MDSIAVMTSGGDAPGMNACIRSVVRFGISAGKKVFGVRRGYAGLMAGDIVEMTSRSVGGIIRTGGTVLMSARAPEFMEVEGQRKAFENLRGSGIEGLVVIGGDGSLRGALALHRLGLPVMGVPASIDNDIAMTEMCIGVDTALNTIIEAVDKIKDTASAHQRAFVIEVMGRRHGYLALMAGVAGGAERVILPDSVVDTEEIKKDVREAFSRTKPHYIVLLAEGAHEHDKFVMDVICDAIEEAGYDTRRTVLGHVQRGGSPTVFDRLLSTRFGAKAVRELLSGVSGKMVSLHADSIVSVDLETVLSSKAELRRDILEIAGPLAM